MSALEEHMELILDGLQAATPGTDHNAHVVWHRRDIQPGVLHRLARRRQRELDEALGPPRLLAVHVVERVEALDLASDMHAVAAGVETRDLGYAGASGARRLPRGGGIVSQWGNQPDAGDAYTCRHMRKASLWTQGKGNR